MPTKDLETQIRDYLRAHPGSSFRTLAASITAPRSSVWDALKRMERAGTVMRHNRSVRARYTVFTETVLCHYCGTIMRYNAVTKQYKCRNPLCNRIMPLSHLTPMQLVSKKVR